MAKVPAKPSAMNGSAESSGPSSSAPLIQEFHANGHFAPDLEPWQRDLTYDPRRQAEPWRRRRSAGKALRAHVARSAHAGWKAPGNRPDPLDTIALSNEGRQPDFVPLRMQRMAGSPYAFFRGAACIMAWDLSRTPATGIHAVIDGDAHLDNFGLYGTPEQNVVFDLNDFDEVTFGPWEWDLKRLATSVELAARGKGLSAEQARRSVIECVEGYRGSARRLQSRGIIEVWYQHFAVEPAPTVFGMKLMGVPPDPAGVNAFGRAILKVAQSARSQTSRSVLPKLAQRHSDGSWRFIEDPPVMTRVDDATAQEVVSALADYDTSLTNERGFMLRRYRVADVAHRVVGVGSVGTRDYLVLLFGNGEGDPLLLQVKEAVAPAAAPYLKPLPFTHQGRRVVYGEHLLQALTDPMLGWTTLDGRDFYVRLLRNMKGAFPIADAGFDAFRMYALSCGALLARAHARTGDIAKIAGYCGNSGALDEALAAFAKSYADQTEADHARLVKAIKRKQVAA